MNNKRTFTYEEGFEDGHNECAKEILLAIHNAGGCDGKDMWDKGYDCGIKAAIEVVEKLTGVTIDTVLELDS